VPIVGRIFATVVYDFYATKIIPTEHRRQRKTLVPSAFFKKRHGKVIGKRVAEGKIFFPKKGSSLQIYIKNIYFFWDVWYNRPMKKKSLLVMLSVCILGVGCFLTGCSAKVEKYYSDEEIAACKTVTYTAKGAVLAYGGGFDQNDEQRMIIVNKSIELSGVEHPKMLFMASGHMDEIEETENFVELYKQAGCTTETLAPSKATAEEIETKIGNADIIYETGGNLNFLSKTWSASGVFPLIREAFERGTILVGVSTGCMCWGDRGYDSAGEKEVVRLVTDFPFIGKEAEYDYFDATGILPFCLGVHFDNIAYRTFGFEAVKLDTPSLCLDNGTAVIYRGGKYQFMTDPTTPNRKATFYYPERGIKKVDVTNNPELVEITDAYLRLNGYQPRTK